MQNGDIWEESSKILGTQIPETSESAEVTDLC